LGDRFIMDVVTSRNDLGQSKDGCGRSQSPSEMAVAVLFPAKANQGIHQQNEGLASPALTRDSDLGVFDDGYQW
jgi:hypothetical protein